MDMQANSCAEAEQALAPENITGVPFKLHELARLALGTESWSKANVAVLHSLVNILLKKLDCSDEVVSIAGLEGRCLKRQLEKSQSTPLLYNDVGVASVSQRLQELDQLQARIEQVDSKIEAHFEQVRLTNESPDNKFEWSSWERYAEPCEDICMLCDEDNHIACNLLRNQHFMQKLMRRICEPVVDRMFEFEDKIVVLSARIDELIERGEQWLKNVKVLEKCIHEVETLRRVMDEHQVQFLATMEEVQDMLDAKLDKIHMPALKKYIRDRFADLDNTLANMKKVEQCPRAAGLLMGDLVCLSCGNDKICAERGVKGAPLLKSTRPNERILTSKCKLQPCVPPKPKRRPHCGCTGQCLQEINGDSLLQRMSKLNLEAEFDKQRNPERRNACRIGAAHRVDLILGENGNYYRADPEVEIPKPAKSPKRFGN